MSSCYFQSSPQGSFQQLKCAVLWNNPKSTQSKSSPPSGSDGLRAGCLGEEERNSQASSSGFLTSAGSSLLFWLGNHGFCPLPSLPSQERRGREEGQAGEVFLVLDCLNGFWRFLGLVGDES